MPMCVLSQKKKSMVQGQFIAPDQNNTLFLKGKMDHVRENMLS